jgi:ADP-dependent NAD(P)H-hydrate dehydratase
MAKWKRVYGLPELPPRDSVGHKGTFGRVLVVGGCAEMLGAPVLAGTSALRSGAGLVQVAMHSHLLPAALSVTPELVGLSLSPANDERLVLAGRKADVLVLGPGMGTGELSKRRLGALLPLGKPTVMDADAVNLYAGGLEAELPEVCVWTPHPGEMSRLAGRLGIVAGAIGDRERIAQAVEAAGLLRGVVVLKGARTVVTDGQRVWVCGVADSSLAKAGTGDVLAGLLAALLAAGMGGFEAAALAVSLHARAGVAAGRRLGPRSVLARDVIDELPAQLRGS